MQKCVRLGREAWFEISLRVTMDAPVGRKIARAKWIFGVKYRLGLRAVVFDAPTHSVIWQQGTGDRCLIPGGNSQRRMAERSVRDLRDALGQ